jgi:DNA-binding protein YbaB
MEVAIRMDIDETIRQATEELRQQQARLHAVRERIEESRTTVRSTDGMITVVLDGRGELTSLSFNTTKFRQMAPAELGAAVVKVINKARVESRDEMLRAYGPLMPRGLGPAGSARGPADLDQMFDDVVRRGTEMLSAEAPAPRTDRYKEGNANE